MIAQCNGMILIMTHDMSGEHKISKGKLFAMQLVNAHIGPGGGLAIPKTSKSGKTNTERILKQQFSFPLITFHSHSH